MMHPEPHSHPAPPDSADCAAACPLADSAIGRRAFIARSAMAAAAAALLAACGGAGDATAPATLSGTIKVSDFAALATVGGVALTSVNGSPVAVVRTAASTFVVLSRICPHEGALISTSSSGFTCPRHGAQFSSTGTWTGGQRTSSLHAYATTYDATAGTITVG